MAAGISSLASAYGARGWKLVRLYGVVEPGVCTCWKGRDCTTPGKHPSGGEAWHLSATGDEEEIASWFDSGKPVNVGLLLGPKSGIIDVELDGEEAKQVWRELDLGEIWTPTYNAGRGPHRLFRWSEDLPAAAVKKIAGIEIRIGNDGRAAQSVIPPSTHHTGVPYQWVPGMGPDEVEPQPLPLKLVNLLWNHDGGRSVVVPRREPANALLHRGVKQGERNNEVHRFAVREAFRCGANLDDQTEQSDLMLKCSAVNSIACKPPLSMDEVKSIVRSAINYVRKTRAEGVSPDEAIAAAVNDTKPSQNGESGDGDVHERKHDWMRTFTESGLSWGPLVPGTDCQPEWGPGDWRLTVVHSDPLEYRLHVSAWREWTGGTGNISLTVDQYRSAVKTAAAVLAATGVVMLDDHPGKWKKIWDGGAKVKDVKTRDKEGKPEKFDARIVRGVKAKLLDMASHDWPGASSLRYVLLAGWLYDRLSQASQPSEDDVPDPTGRACWRKDGTLWFSWGKVWEDIERQHRINEGERLALKRRILSRTDGSKDFRHSEYRHIGGTRKSYVVWSASDFSVLERLANEQRQHGTEGHGETGQDRQPPAGESPLSYMGDSHEGVESSEL